MGKKGGKKGIKGNTGPRPAAGSRKNPYEKGDVAKPSNVHKGGSGTSRNDADTSNADNDKASIERTLANSQSLQKGIDEMVGWLKAMKVAEGQGGQLDAGSANTNDPTMASQTEATERDCTESSVPQTFPKKSTFSGSSAEVSSKASGESGYSSMIRGLGLKRRGGRQIAREEVRVHYTPGSLVTMSPEDLESFMKPIIQSTEKVSFDPETYSLMTAEDHDVLFSYLSNKGFSPGA